MGGEPLFRMNMEENHAYFMKRAIELAEKGMQQNVGGPFGAVVVRNGEIIAEGYNQVTSDKDPTAHAEIMAIRNACKKLNAFQLTDCVIYTSCEPCPMCLGAIYWSRPKAVYYACNHQDAARIDFDDQFIYDEIAKRIDQRRIRFTQFMRDESLKVFEQWKEKGDKIKY